MTKVAAIGRTGSRPLMPAEQVRLLALGRKVSDGLAKAQAAARAITAARRAKHEAMILTLATEEIVNNKPRWGRSGRVQKKLLRQGVRLSEAYIRKILLRLSGRRD